MKFKAAWLALFAAVNFLAVSIVWAEKIDEQEKLQIIRKELKENQTKLQQTKIQQQEVLGKLAAATKEIKRADKKLKLAKTKIQVNEAKIGELMVELKDHQTNLEQKASQLEKRVLEVHKSGGIQYFGILFNAQSLSDFFNRVYFFEKIIEQDSNLIRGIRGDLQETKSAKTVLANRTEEIKELAEVIAEEKQVIAQEAEEKKKALAQLKDRQEEYENKIAELEKSSQELEVLIRKKMAERTKAGIVARGSGVISWPLRGRMTSRYGTYRRSSYNRRHTGIDIAAPHGTPIVAADGGEVIYSGWWDGYGKAIVIDHGRGTTTVYGHMSRLYLPVGANVAKGQTIGLVGSTGYSTGPHLHFEVRKNGRPVNPMGFLP